MSTPTQLVILSNDLVSLVLDNATEAEFVGTIHAHTTGTTDHERLIFFLASLSASLVEYLPGGRELFEKIAAHSGAEATVDDFRNEIDATLDGSELNR